MKTLRIMSVGRSGTGKSTIGNMLLTGKAQSKFFDVSASSVSCTQKSSEMKNEKGDCVYVDVPGIPDTNPDKTAAFYDLIIKEAKKELNVILFVFDFGRQDQAAFELAEMLFRQLNQSNPVKILVINDKNNYALCEPPTEADYEEKATVISKITKITFTNKIFITAETMNEKLAYLKILLSETSSYTSKHLLSFAELSKYVNQLRKDKTHKEAVIKESRDRIKKIQNRIDSMNRGQPTRASRRIFEAFFRWGGLSKHTQPTKEEARSIAISLLESEKKYWERKISELNLEQSTKELERSCELFDDLKKALRVN